MRRSRSTQLIREHGTGRWSEHLTQVAIPAAPAPSRMRCLRPIDFARFRFVTRLREGLR